MNESPYSIVLRSPELLAIFGALIVIEFVWCSLYRNKSYGAGEAVASIGIAAGRAFAKILMGLVLGGLFLSVYQLRLLDIDMSDWKAWLALFLGADYLYYWMHRLKNDIRCIWADHAVHHSGNYMNFFINYRLGWTGLIVGTWLVYLPLVWIGFPPATVVSVFALSLVWQFWVHTDMIGKLGPLEWVLNTPSHHRVHHACNPVYLDRNHAGILIIWDRMFGTFQEELESEPCVYGLVRPLRSLNPFVIAFHEWGNLIRDVRRAATWKDRLRAAFGYPGDKRALRAARATTTTTVKAPPTPGAARSPASTSPTLDRRAA